MQGPGEISLTIALTAFNASWFEVSILQIVRHDGGTLPKEGRFGQVTSICLLTLHELTCILIQLSYTFTQALITIFQLSDRSQNLYLTFNTHIHTKIQWQAGSAHVTWPLEQVSLES